MAGTGAVTNNNATNAPKDTKSSGLDKISQEKNPSKAEVSQAKLGSDFNQFLRLFTTQLQNQDPTQPLDTNQLTQQLATLSSVEQAVQTNLNLEKMVNLFSAGTISNAVGYIGKAVDAKGNLGTLENGKAEFSYEMPGGVTSAQIAISTPSGQVVYTGNAPTASGKGTFVWNGNNIFTGAKMPDGAYTIKVLAKDSAGKDVDVATYSTGRVTAVDLVDGKTSLVLAGGQSVELSDVISIREIATPTPAPASNQANSGTPAKSNNTASGNGSSNGNTNNANAASSSGNTANNAGTTSGTSNDSASAGDSTSGTNAANNGNTSSTDPSQS